MHDDCQKEERWGEQNKINADIVDHIKEANCDGGHRQQLRDCVKALDFVTRNFKWLVVFAFVAGCCGGIIAVLLAISTTAGQHAIGYLVKLLR